MAFIRKSSGMLFILVVKLQDWVFLFDGATHKSREVRHPWPRPENNRPLTDNVRLPRDLADFLKFELGRHESPVTVTQTCGATLSPSVQSKPISVAHR